MTEYEALLDGTPKLYGGYPAYLKPDLYPACPAQLKELVRPNGDHSVAVREQVTAKYGYSILTSGALQLIKRHTYQTALVEVGAGIGYWAHELQKSGVDVVPTDLEPDPERSWVPVEQLHAVDAVEKYRGRNLLIVWPNDYNQYAGWSDEVLRAFRGDLVFYCGEGKGGCTGSDRFHALLQECWRLIDHCRLPTWEGVHDQLEVYERRSAL